MEPKEIDVEIGIVPESVPLNECLNKSDNKELTETFLKDAKEKRSSINEIDIPQSSTTENLIEVSLSQDGTVSKIKPVPLDSKDKKKRKETKKILQNPEKIFLILTSSDHYEISNFLRVNESDDFWTNKIDLNKVMNFYSENKNAKLENFMSVLIYDWFDQTGPTKKYFLVRKFKSFEQVSNSEHTIFERLFEILNDGNGSRYHHICLLVILQYFDEAEESYEYLGNNINEQVLNDDHINKLVEGALLMTNEEYKVEILKILVTFLRNTNHESIIFFEGFKTRILKSFESSLSHKSICEISYKAIQKYLNYKFFQLAFYLKENSVPKFKIEFRNYIDEHKELLGEAWNHIIKFNAQLLYHMAFHQGFVDTKEFIELTTGIFELKHSLMTCYKELAEFRIVFGPLGTVESNLLASMEKFIDKDYEISYDDYEHHINLRMFKELFLDKKTHRKLLFGRKTLDSESLLEQFLSKNRAHVYRKSDHVSIMGYVMNEFQLWNKPEIFIIKNPLGKSLLDYALQTENNIHVISFLLPDFEQDPKTVSRPCQFMMLKNALFYDTRGINFIDYHLELIDLNKRADPYHMPNLFYLFEEISIHSSEPDRGGVNEYIKQLFDKKIEQVPEKYDGIHELKLPRKHFLIGVVMIYWKYQAKRGAFDKLGEDENEEIFFFNLLMLILLGNSKKFQEEFPAYVEKFQNYFLDFGYEHKISHSYEQNEDCFHFYEKCMTNFLFVLLYAAIKTEQKEIVELIFKYENFLISVPSFPINMQPSEIHEYTALKFLENKYEIGRGDLPRNWITRNVLEKFLDSRVSSYGNFYRIDCRFLLPYYNHDVNVKSSSEVTDDHIFNEDFDTMDYITSDQELKSLVSHPVMETVIKAKIQKYSNMLLFNHIGFLFIYLLPTLYLVKLYHMEKHWNYTLISFVNLLRLPYLIAREYFQFKIIYVSDRRYFKEKGNMAELSLILLPVLLFFITMAHMIEPTLGWRNLVFTIEAINILAIIVGLAYQFSGIAFLIYLECFKRIFLIHLNIFLTFLPFTAAFAALACIIIIKYNFEDQNEFGTLGVTSNVDMSLETFLNQMDLRQFMFLQAVIIAVIFAFLVIKTNLVISMVINDIKAMYRRAKEASLLKTARNFVLFSKSIRTFYAINEDNTKKGPRLLLQIMKFFLRDYPFIHRLQTILVEKQSGRVLSEVNRPIFSTHDVRNIWNEAIGKVLKLNPKVLFKFQKITNGEFRDWSCDSSFVRAGKR